MSEENVEIVRRANAAFNDGDLDAFLKEVAPDAELHCFAWKAVVSGHPRDTARAMSKESVEIVRRSYDAYLRGDLESALAACDPEIEIYDHDIPDSGEYRGFEGLARWQADWESSWESWRWDPEEFIEAGERVVAVLRVHARGRQSGVDVERVDAAVWTLRDGKCVRLDYYGSREQALEAAGLSE